MFNLSKINNLFWKIFYCTKSKNMYNLKTNFLKIKKNNN